MTLSLSQMPAHNHTVEASSNQATAASPAGNYLPTSQPKTTTPYATGPAGTAMGQGMISNTGGSQSHPNLQPFLVINYIIATQGIFPSRP